MKVILLSSTNSIHTIQWVHYLCKLGLDVRVISQHPIADNFPKEVKVHVLPFSGFLGYFFNVFAFLLGK